MHLLIKNLKRLIACAACYTLKKIGKILVILFHNEKRQEIQDNASFFRNYSCEQKQNFEIMLGN